MRPILPFLIPLVVFLGGAAIVISCDRADRQDTILPAERQTSPGQPVGIAPGAAGFNNVISDADLKKAAVAHVALAEVRFQLHQALQDLEIPDQRQKLQDEANIKMIEAVENTGLSFEAYNEIMEVVVRNQALSDQFQAIVRQVE
jgi:hypothetical protein